MTQPRLVLALAALMLPASKADATSWVRIPPHQPALACQAIERAVDEMTGKQAPKSILPLTYDDEFGFVGYNERDAFIRSMTSAEGKPDERPIRITMVWPVGKRKATDAKALYVLGLQRSRWFPEHEDSFDPMHIVPAGYQIDTSYWLVAFSGQQIVELRQGRYLFDLIDYDKRLKGCGQD